MNTEKHFKLSYKVQINTCFFRQFDERIEMVNAHRLQEIRKCVRPGFGIEVLEIIED